MSEQTSQSYVRWAYGVFDGLKQALDHVALNPENLEQLELELLNKMPDLFEALMVLLPVEHRGIVYEVFESTGRMGRTWMKKKIESKRKNR